MVNFLSMFGREFVFFRFMFCSGVFFLLENVIMLYWLLYLMVVMVRVVVVLSVDIVGDFIIGVFIVLLRLMVIR